MAQEALHNVARHSRGRSASVVVQVLAQPVHYVASGSINPVQPYTSWETAARNIQDAVDAASLPGALVLVTNGLYSSGGKIMSGDLLNRVVVDKPILLQSLNGPSQTTIQGAWHPGTTNGPSAVRCVWITNGAILNGFTITGGATRRTTGVEDSQQVGGGVWGYSNAIVGSCHILNNAASYAGGGAAGIVNHHRHPAFTARQFGQAGRIQQAGLQLNHEFERDMLQTLWQNGGDVWNKDATKCTLDDPATMEAIQWYSDLRNKHKVALPTIGNTTDAQNSMIAGKAMVPVPRISSARSRLIMW